MNRCLASLLLFSASSLPLFGLPSQVATNANPAASAWVPVGPDGGDARSFAADPTDSRHLYLGTTNSWIYESLDEGGAWHRLAKLEQHVIGYVHDIVDGILADGFEALPQPFGQFVGHLI